MKLKSLSWMMLLSLLLAGLHSCNDDDLFSASDGYALSSRLQNVSGSSHLVLQEDGCWLATERVPLVGRGRVVDNLSLSVVSVGDIAQETDPLVDTDLDNYYKPKEILQVDALLNQIVSVRDLNHVYAGGQKAGFLCKNLGSSVLDLTVLSGYWIDTYLNGERQEHHIFKGATSLLDLGIGNISGGTDSTTFVLEATFEKPFDEVRLGCDGVKAELVKSIAIYYAYVGENPMIPAVNDGNPYFNNKVTTPYEGGYLESTMRSLVDADLKNGITIGLVSSLAQPHMSVDFGREVPAGTEVGYYVTSAELLTLGVAKSVLLKTLDENGNEVEQFNHTKIVSLGLASGGQYIYSFKTTKPCRRLRIAFLGVNVKLGLSTVHYAFVREPTTVDPSSYFSVSNATVYNPNYRFPDVENGSVKYELVEKPGRSTAVIGEDKYGGVLLKGMNVTGNYKVKATYMDKNGNTYEQFAVITRLNKGQSNCEDCLVNTTDNPNLYEAYYPDGFEGITLGGGKDEMMGNVVSADKTKFAHFTSVHIKLANDQALIGVKRIDGQKINTKGTKKRVGFVVSKSVKFLDANVLQFMRIKLYDGDKVVNAAVAKQNNGVSLSLIGGSKDKIRFSIDTEAEFDRVELFTSGLADIDLGDMKVYYAFVEETTDCGDPGEECMQLISNGNYNATASVQFKGAVNAIGTSYNLSYMVDNNMKTHAVVALPVSVGNATIIKVKFNTIKANQEAGFIFDNVSGVASLTLIEAMKIRAIPVDEEDDNSGETTSGSLLALKVTGSGDKTYVSITPNYDFKGLELTIGDGLEALKTLLVNGVYLRPDYDGDGIMDCVDDELSTVVSALHVEPQDICIRDVAKFRVDGGEENVPYQLEFINKHGETSVGKAEVLINNEGYLDFTNKDFFSSLPVGEYWVSVLDEKGKTILNRGGELTIHSRETTWKGKKNTNWNDWDNWDRGTPWYCTNVILPTGCSRYPELTDNDKKQPCCQNIHFAPGAELVGQHHLKYDMALVDMALTTGAYQLLSAPLRSMATGDMFVQKQSRQNDWDIWRNAVDEKTRFHTNYFSVVTDNGTGKVGDYQESRVSPIIYQRFFSKTVKNVTMTRAARVKGDAAIKQTNWSRSFNAVATEYESGQGFALKVQKIQEKSNYTFHFPKFHTHYNYYDVAGNSLNISESVKRLNVGELMVDNESMMPYNVLMKRQSNGTEFLFGNPFMAHINILRLLKGNSNVISSVLVYSNGEYVTINTDGTSSRPTPPALIKPMEAVFVVAKKAASDLTVVVTDEMLMQAASSAARVRPASTASPRIYLTARARKHTSSCMALQTGAAYDKRQGGTNAPFLLEIEAKPEVAVFTVGNGEALSVQRVKAASHIPVGFFMKSKGNVQLSFRKQGEGWNTWVFVDGKTGKKYPLNKSITLSNVTTGSDRFYLEKVK